MFSLHAREYSYADENGIEQTGTYDENTPVTPIEPWDGIIKEFPRNILTEEEREKIGAENEEASRNTLRWEAEKYNK